MSKDLMNPIFYGSRQSWKGMKQRCNNPNSTHYKHYGGRGITYDPKWETFEGFLQDMGIRPENRTLERVENDGPYCKENCVWATRSEQMLNRRQRTVLIKISERSTTGINGISWYASREVFVARGKVNGQVENLYRGPNFFEACCARRSWENKQIQKRDSYE